MTTMTIVVSGEQRPCARKHGQSPRQKRSSAKLSKRPASAARKPSPKTAALPSWWCRRRNGSVRPTVPEISLRSLPNRLCAAPASKPPARSRGCARSSCELQHLEQGLRSSAELRPRCHGGFGSRLRLRLGLRLRLTPRFLLRLPLQKFAIERLRLGRQLGTFGVERPLNFDDVVLVEP